MRAKRFTAISVAAIKPKNERVEYTDGSGLSLIVGETGRKSWHMRYRRPGSRKTANLKLGSYPAVPLVQARVFHAEARHKLAQGIDPDQERKSAKAAAELAAGTTLRAIAEKYLKQEEAKPRDVRLRTIDQRRATFERLIYPKLGGRPIAEIRRGEIVRLLDEVEVERGGRMADGVLTVLKIVFDWHAIRDESFRSPIVRGMARVRPKDRMRSRVLSDSELREVWRAADSMGPFGAFVQLLILTATRRNEAARMRRSELSNGDWLIPASRYKSKKPHLIPLSKAAQELLAKQPQIVDCDYVFALDGARPLNSFGRGKELLDKLSGVTGWTLHDTRRVARSLLSRAGISNDVAEMCLGHSLPTLRRTYDLHGFYREKARAFELLAQEVGRVVNPPPAGKVVRLGSRRRG